jgi:hypothetical protein
MNKDLYGNTVQLPEDVVEYLQQCFDSANTDDSTIEGFKRNQELRDSRETTYQQLKRMKNWFDNFNGLENDLPFILNGGHYVKNWVNDTLGGMRNNVYMGKKSKSEVLPNQFIQTHTKDNLNTMNRQSKSHSSTTGNINKDITESLKRINELIKKII